MPLFTSCLLVAVHRGEIAEVTDLGSVDQLVCHTCSCYTYMVYTTVAGSSS